MEITTMLTNESTTEAPTQSDLGVNGPVIVSPSTPKAFIQSETTPNGEAQAPEAAAPGLAGEETIWEGHYSSKNFIGRVLFGGLLTLAWLYLAFRTWGASSNFSSVWATGLGIVVVLYWLNLGYRYFRAYRGHHYRLTTRRLFVTTGFFQRRVDQIELLRIKDVYMQQSLIGDWLGIGNVVVITSEKTLPKAYLLGIEDPRRLMDLVWHYMRLEQNQLTDRVEPV
jgi:membrane protein YdbS with pleckstrin-like domain